MKGINHRGPCLGRTYRASELRGDLHNLSGTSETIKELQRHNFKIFVLKFMGSHNNTSLKGQKNATYNLEGLPKHNFSGSI
jgi:hypothetical protein